MKENRNNIEQDHTLDRATEETKKSLEKYQNKLNKLLGTLKIFSQNKTNDVNYIISAA